MFRLRLLLAALTLCGALAAAPAASAAPGELDPGFGSGGMVKLLDGSEGEGWAEGIAVQPDGKIVLAGYEKGNAVVLRLLPNGQPDAGFGSGGKATLDFPGGRSEARAVALQPNGEIVIAGEAEVAGNVDFLIARYNPDGSPDASFGGGDGIETVPVGSEEDEAQDVAIGPDGRIAATGTVDLPGGENGLGVVVLGPDGTPDASFGGDGSLVKQTAIGEGDDRGVAVALLSGGRVLLGDECGAGRGNGFVLLQLLSDGSFDPGFGGGDGIVETPIPGEGLTIGLGRITDFALLPDGRIVASGYGADYGGSPPGYTSTVAAVRYTPEGELDSSFASGGIFTHRIDDEGLATAVALGEKGRILLGGEYELPGTTTNADWVARLNPDGSLDPSFGSGGLVVRADTAPFGEAVENIAVDSEDRLVTVSSAYGGSNTEWTVVTRYLGDPRPPTPGPTSAPGVQNRPPHAQMKRVPKKLRVGKLSGFSGTASDPDGNGVAKVQLALVKRARGGAKARASARGRLRCFALNAKLRFKRVKAKGKQCPRVWVPAKGTTKWRFKLKGMLPPGRYVVFARAVDGAGLAESSFSRKLRNRYGFRVVPPR
ncbi:MAG TPA: delta-60 repeat domain-containing protein [Solirubrobacterales bacterium]|nr:delta-60 repeat domain-containing protein [Solirubrobacterales bacterium]